MQYDKKMHSKSYEVLKMIRHKYGLIEDKEDNVFFNLGTFDTFEEAITERETKSIFRDKKKLIIIQRVDVD